MKKIILSSIVASVLLSTQFLIADTAVNMRVDYRYSKPHIPIPGHMNYANKFKQADLVITEIKKMGRVVVPRSNRNIKVPIRITVKNRGKRTAKRFKVATEIFVPHLNNYYFIKLYAPGYSSSRPTVRVNLAPGQSTSIYGKLVLSKKYKGRNIRVRAKADDCGGEEFRRSYCRVQESNERNNYSGNARIVIPR